MMKSDISVLLVDDHTILMDGLETLIGLRTRDDVKMSIVAKVTSGEEAIKVATRETPDVVLMDVKMDGIDGIRAAERIKERNAATKIIILTNYTDKRYVARALTAGVEGYLLKDVPFDSLIQTIVDIFHGNIIISPHLVGPLSKILNGDDSGDVDEEPKDENIPELSVREREILYLLARGMTNGEIAEDLFISEKTVRNYISRIYDIIGVKNRAQAVLRVIEKS